MFLSRRTTTSTSAYWDSIRRVKALLQDADAVILGAGAGLSTSAGFTYAGQRFTDHFSDFAQKYGFQDMYSGGFYPFESPEEYWAYWSRYVLLNRYSGQDNGTYKALRSLLTDKDYFVLTTNVDHQFQKAGFDKHRLFYMQGDYGLFQCSAPCCQRTYDNEDTIRQMVERQKNMRVPRELVPRCPVCGKPMTMNLRIDSTFVEDAGWHKAAERYSEFLRRHQGLRLLFLELGVGMNTPGIIKVPFWQMVYENPKAYYVNVNLTEAAAPPEIQRRSIYIQRDIGDVLRSLAS